MSTRPRRLKTDAQLRRRVKQSPLPIADPAHGRAKMSIAQIARMTAAARRAGVIG